MSENKHIFAMNPSDAPADAVSRSALEKQFSDTEKLMASTLALILRNKEIEKNLAAANEVVAFLRAQLAEQDKMNFEKKTASSKADRNERHDAK